jgi:hypothetical protein
VSVVVGRLEGIRHGDARRVERRHLDGRGSADRDDLDLAQQALGTTYGGAGFDLRADFNGDGYVTSVDIGIVLEGLYVGDFDLDKDVEKDDFAAFQRLIDAGLE